MRYELIAVVMVISLIALGALLPITPSLQLKSQESQVTTTYPEIKKFSNYDEFAYFISKMRSLAREIYGEKEVGILREFSIPPLPMPQPSPMPMIKGYGSEAKIPYSKTNVQVEEVDEPDIVKIDGKYMYLCSMKNNLIYILKIYPPNEASLLSTINISGYPIGIFLYDDTLVIFYVEGIMLRPMVFREEAIPKATKYQYPNTTVLIVDVSNREEPVIKHKLVFEGAYVGSRLIDNYVYLIVQAPLQGEKPKLPKFQIDKYRDDIKVNKISYADIVSYSYNLITVFSINVDTAEVKYDSFLFPYASIIYVSRNNMYITTMKVLVKEKKPLEATLIYKVRITGGNISVVAYGEVPGRVLNQFSMDEYNGYFRIATTIREGWRSSEVKNSVYVLNETLDIIGKVEGLGVGERIYGVRFMGEIGFVVTFRIIDPLFIIDLSDPENPKVIGELKIPGYSAYLHPITQNLLLGVGMEIEVKNDAIRTIGVKVSLFNIENLTNPIEVSKVVLAEGSTSPVLHEHKAFLYYPEKKLAFIPITIPNIVVLSTIGGKHYKRLTYQGVMIIYINIEDQKLEVIGNITQTKYAHNEDVTNYYIKRTAYVGEYLYTISNKLITIHDLNTLELIKTIELTP